MCLKALTCSFAAAIFVAASACQIQDRPDDIPAYQVTFRVIPQSLPDSATVYITGNNTLLGNFFGPRTPAMQKQANGEWHKIFVFPEDLRVRCNFNLGSRLSTAVDDDGQPLDTLFFIVKQDTTIVVDVANWQNEILSAEEKSHPNYRAEEYFVRASHLRHLNFGIGTQASNDSARYYFEKALELFQLQKNWARLAHCYHVMRALYPIDTKLQYLEKALAISLTRLGERHPETAEIYNRLGEYYKDRGDYARALEYVNRGLAIQRKISGESHPDLFWSYYRLADIYGQMEEYEKALEYSKKTMAVVTKIDGPTHQNAGNVNKFIGILYSKMGDFDKGIAHFKKAIKILDIYTDKLSVTTHMNYFELGDIYMRAGKYESAEDCYQKALMVTKKMYHPYHGHIYGAYRSLAEATAAQHDYEAALTYNQQALQTLLPGFVSNDVNGNPSIENISYYRRAVLKTLVQKGRILNEMVRQQTKYTMTPSLDAVRSLETALDCYDKALQQASLALGGFLSTSAKLAMQQRLSEVVEQAVQVALRLSEMTGDSTYKEQAWRFSERGKSAILRLAVQESQAKKFAGIDNAILEQEQALRDEVVKYETSISKAYQTKGRDAADISSLESTYYRLKSQHESLLSDLAEKYPYYFELKHSPPAATIDEVQKTLDVDAVLLEYFVGKNDIYIFVVTKELFDIVTLPKNQDFSQQVQEHAALIRQVVKSSAYIKSSARLYNLLIRPVELFIAAKDKLIIIPDGVLYYVPFEALVSADRVNSLDSSFSKQNYLIGQYEISYHYSTNLLLASANKPKPVNASRQLLAVAPVFRQENNNGYISPGNSGIFEDVDEPQKRAFVTRSGSHFRELRHSEGEVRTIVDLFANSGSIGYFHRQATEDRFKAEAGNYRFVHISTHGFMNEINPKLSGLAFSQPADSIAAEDGILYAAEAYTLELNADLVVLSSCESGIGKIAAGEGVMSMTRGFLYAGARNVVVSLWKVFDEHTSELMIEFYRGVATGESYATALRKAKLKMLAKPETARPASWASFVLVGR